MSLINFFRWKKDWPFPLLVSASELHVILSQLSPSEPIHNHSTSTSSSAIPLTWTPSLPEVHTLSSYTEFWDQQVKLNIVFKPVSLREADIESSLRIDTELSLPCPSLLAAFSETGSVETPDQVFTNSKCSYNEDSSQLGQTFSYFPNDGSLKFISTRLGANQHQHPTFLTRSSVGHNALKLNAGSGSGITLSMAPGA